MTSRPENLEFWRASRNWSPSPAIRASFLAHGAGATLLALAPQLWPQVLGALALNHGALMCGMHPRSALLGHNLVRLPDEREGRVALTFDDGPHPEITPRVLDILDAFGAKASFFVIGRRAARHPALLREILRRGHGVENHTQRHLPGFACLGPVGQWRELRQAQEAIADAAGHRPRYFRAPYGLHSPLLDPALTATELGLVSWTRRGLDTRRARADRVLARLTNGLAQGDILLLHDGESSARDAEGRPIVLEVLPALLRRIAALGLTATALPPPSAA